jgi:DNA polymerase-3 subunit gamma/tau
MQQKRDIDSGLHIKWRPQKFEEIIGNEAVVAGVSTLLARGEGQGEIRSWLFSGPSGTGKTTIARIIANYLGCSSRDFYELDAGGEGGIDTIREITKSINYAPLSGKIKVYLLDEAHGLTQAAQNKLLKILEDTPKHVRFILCTTEPEKLKDTIIQRCNCWTMSLLTSPKMRQLLTWICQSEGIAIEQSVLNEIIKYGEGSARRALGLLDKILDITDEDQALEILKRISASNTNMIEICQKILLAGTKWETLSKMIKSIEAEEPEKIRRAVLEYMAKVLLSKDDNRAANIIQIFNDSWMYTGKAGMVLSFYLTTKL